MIQKPISAGLTLRIWSKSVYPAESDMFLLYFCDGSLAGSPNIKGCFISLVEHRGLTRIASRSAVLRRPAQAAWTRRCSTVHRTVSRRSGPFGFSPPISVLRNNKRPPNGGLLLLVEQFNIWSNPHMRTRSRARCASNDDTKKARGIIPLAILLTCMSSSIPTLFL